MISSPLSVYRFLLLFVAGWILWITMQVLLINWLGFSWKESLIDSIVSNMLLVAACVLVSNNLRFYLPQRRRYWYILVLCIGLSLLWILLCRWILVQVNSGTDAYLSFLTKSLPVRFGIGFLIIECMALMSILWYALEEQRENEERKLATENLAREAELYKLRQQLQPHFLFNSLNSINALIGTRPEEARHMIQQLSDFLRGTLKKEENEWVSFSEELKYLQLYLDIEKVRFGHRLSPVIEKDEASEGLKLPPLLLQPLVENAIKFGLYDTTEGVTIHISAKSENQQLVITVQNPFDPETAQPLKGTGFGLSSVQRRLQLLFAQNDLLETSFRDNIFTTTIKIPQRHD